MKNKEYAIIVAGGKGTRLKNNIAKQFLELNGLPVLMHTLQAFFRYNNNLTVVLVLPEDDLQLWNELCKKHSFHKPIIIQKGGETRFQSVENGLTKIEDDGLVAIHDGVRPLVSEEIIRTSFALAASNKAAVAAIPLKDSIREMQNPGDISSSASVDRSKFRIIQTPQTFEIGLIKKAYQQKEDSSFTDDASVVEKAGHAITLFEGSYENIKITTPEDLLIAEALLRARK